MSLKISDEYNNAKIDVIKGEISQENQIMFKNQYEVHEE